MKRTVGVKFQGKIRGEHFVFEGPLGKREKRGDPGIIYQNKMMDYLPTDQFFFFIYMSSHICSSKLAGNYKKPKQSATNLHSSPAFYFLWNITS